MTLRICLLLLAALAAAHPLSAQLGASARRVLGQPDLRENSFNSLEGSETFSPSAAAFDKRGDELHLYVADRGNRRVLGWRDAAAAQSGAPADIVIGQFDLTRSAPFGIGAGGFSAPSGLAVDAETGRLFVSDSGANRVTRFPYPFGEEQGIEPDRVYGQPDFTTTSANTGGLSGMTMRAPEDVFVDADGNLWVADAFNHRVLRFAADDLDSDQPSPELVLGQFDFGTASANAGIGVSGSGFNRPVAVEVGADGAVYVADRSNSRILVFNGELLTNGVAAVRVIGQASFTSSGASGAGQPWSLRRVDDIALTEDGNLYALMSEDHRGLLFLDAATAIGQVNADGVLGQADEDENARNSGTDPKASADGLSAPLGLAVAPDGEVAITDSGNHRILLYTEGDAGASVVLGQGDMTANSPNRVGPEGVGAALGVAIDYSSEGFPVYASDLLNHRVLGWSSSLRFKNGAPADLVIGQPNFLEALPNRGLGGPNASTLDSPRGIAITAGGDLFVADSGNNRVLRFRRPFETGGLIAADLVLGQSAFFTRTSAFINAGSMNSPTDVEVATDGRIFVSDTGNNRVLEFEADVSTGRGAVRVFGQADFVSAETPEEASALDFDEPLGIAVGQQGFLYVADSGRHRVLIFASSEGTPSAGAAATNVVGQASFEADGPGIGDARLRNPTDVAVASDATFFVADSENHRVLAFQGGLFLPTAGATALGVVGQSSFTRRNVNYDSPDGRATAQGLFQPSSVYADRNGMLYVGDAGNNRVVNYVGVAAAVSAATFLPAVGVSPGSLTSVFGAAFSEDTGAAAEIPLPTELANAVVEFDEGIRAPLVFVSPGQINLQTPMLDETGLHALWVRKADTEELIAGGVVNVASTRPGLFTQTQNGTGLAVALNEDGTLNGPENPAPRGSIVTLFGTGQGPTSPAVADGEAAPGSPPASTAATPTDSAVECLQPTGMCTLIGSKVAETLFSGLAPGFVGLWQLNVRVPAGEDVFPNLLAPIKIVINQTTTNDNVFISTQ